MKIYPLGPCDGQCCACPEHRTKEGTQYAELVSLSGNLALYDDASKTYAFAGTARAGFPVYVEGSAASAAVNGDRALWAWTDANNLTHTVTNAFTVFSVRLFGDLNLDGTVDAADKALAPSLSAEYGWGMPAATNVFRRVRLRTDVRVPGDFALSLSGDADAFRVWATDAPGAGDMPLLSGGKTSDDAAEYAGYGYTDLFVEALGNGTATLTYSYTGTDAADGLSCSASLKMTAFEVNIDPAYEIVVEGDDSVELKAVVKPSGLSGLTYAWFWQTVTNGGNNPSVTFSALDTAKTHVDRAHWYAVPDARCASNQGSDYCLWCTASIGGVCFSNSATMSVQLVDPAGETEPEYEITGGPSIAFNAASNCWYVLGLGTMTRKLTITSNLWLNANSEFIAKITAHENQHSQDFINGFDGHTFMTVAEFYVRISSFTDPTTNGLVNKISQELERYSADESEELKSLKAGLEVRAYNVSDGVAPDYYYSNCGRFIYP